MRRAAASVVKQCTKLTAVLSPVKVKGLREISAQSDVRDRNKRLINLTASYRDGQVSNNESMGPISDEDVQCGLEIFVKDK